MEFKGRGWREERTVWTQDTLGEAMPVTTGVTTNDRDELVAAIAVGTGPSAIVTGTRFLEDLSLNITETLRDREDQRQKRDQARRGRR